MDFQCGSKARTSTHSLWDRSIVIVLADRKTLGGIAKELVREGKRGVGMARVKAGLMVGIMGEEAVWYERFVVGGEMIWVTETFQTNDNNIPANTFLLPPSGRTRAADDSKRRLNVHYRNINPHPHMHPRRSLSYLPRSRHGQESVLEISRRGPSRQGWRKLSQVLNISDKKITPNGVGGSGLEFGLRVGGLGQLAPPAERKRAA